MEREAYSHPTTLSSSKLEFSISYNPLMIVIPVCLKVHYFVLHRYVHVAIGIDGFSM